MKALTFFTLLIFIGVGAWVMTWSPGLVRECRLVYYSAISPFLKSGSEFKNYISSYKEEVQHSKSLRAQLSNLQEDYSRLKLLETRFDKLEAENIQLQQALGFKEETSFEVIPARVLQHQSSAFSKTLLIDKGLPSGLTAQSPVLSQEGLLGRIEESFPNEIANVLLLTDQNCKVSVYVEDTSERGILSGEISDSPEGQTLLRLKHLSKEAALLPGMKVLTTGQGGIFPEGIPVGVVSSFLPGNYESEALVKVNHDFKELQFVFVLTQSKTRSEE